CHTLASHALILAPSPILPLFPYTTLFRSYARPVHLAGGCVRSLHRRLCRRHRPSSGLQRHQQQQHLPLRLSATELREGLGNLARSEEHTSELQSRSDLVCRLLLEKKNNTI